MARRATAIKDIRNISTETVLVLDAGNTLFGQDLAFQTNGKVIVEAMSIMGYDAMTIGLMDLAKGIDVLLECANQAHFEMLSCNLQMLGKSDPVLAPYTIVERDGVRYGIVGVTEPDAINAPGLREVAHILDPVAAVRSYLPEVQRNSDVVIVLSHLGLEEDMALADAIAGIDIIIGGRSRKLLQEPEIVGTTVITQAGYDGEWLGRLDVRFDAQWRPSDPQVTVVTLGPDVPDNPEMRSLVASANERFPSETQLPR